MFLVARERGTAQLQLQAQLVRLYYKRNNKNLQKQKRFISYMDSSSIIFFTSTNLLFYILCYVFLPRFTCYIFIT